MKTKLQIKSIFGSLLFEYEAEDNTIKKTLEKAVEQGVNLQGANFQGANLQGANFQGAYCRGANFQGAYCRGANFQGADLQGANFQGANCRGANFQGADLQGANFQGAKNIDEIANKDLFRAQNSILPQEGDVIGFKKCFAIIQNPIDGSPSYIDVIVKLKIPAKAKRSNAPGGRKCRAEYAEVLEIMHDNVEIVQSKHDHYFYYRVGNIVKPRQPFSENWLSECESGIHFFITKEEAEDY